MSTLAGDERAIKRNIQDLINNFFYSIGSTRQPDNSNIRAYYDLKKSYITRGRGHTFTYILYGVKVLNSINNPLRFIENTNELIVSVMNSANTTELKRISLPITNNSKELYNPDYNLTKELFLYTLNYLKLSKLDTIVKSGSGPMGDDAALRDTIALWDIHKTEWDEVQKKYDHYVDSTRQYQKDETIRSFYQDTIQLDILKAFITICNTSQIEEFPRTKYAAEEEDMKNLLHILYQINMYISLLSNTRSGASAVEDICILDLNINDSDDDQQSLREYLHDISRPGNLVFSEPFTFESIFIVQSASADDGVDYKSVFAHMELSQFNKRMYNPVIGLLQPTLPSYHKISMDKVSGAIYDIPPPPPLAVQPIKKSTHSQNIIHKIKGDVEPVRPNNMKLLMAISPDYVASEKAYIYLDATDVPLGELVLPIGDGAREVISKGYTIDIVNWRRILSCKYIFKNDLGHILPIIIDGIQFASVFHYLAYIRYAHDAFILSNHLGTHEFEFDNVKVDSIEEWRVPTAKNTLEETSLIKAFYAKGLQHPSFRECLIATADITLLNPLDYNLSNGRFEISRALIYVRTLLMSNSVLDSYSAKDTDLGIYSKIANSVVDSPPSEKPMSTIAEESTAQLSVVDSPAPTPTIAEESSVADSSPSGKQPLAVPMSTIAEESSVADSSPSGKQPILECTRHSSMPYFKFLSNTCVVKTELRNPSSSWSFPAYKTQISINQFLTQYTISTVDTFDSLEEAHDYIQWLFPIHTASPHGSRLYGILLPDLNKIRANTACVHNIMEALRIMLQFWGGILITDSISDSDDVKARLRHLNSHPHNNSRITRVILCLVLVGKGSVANLVLNFFRDHVIINTHGIPWTSSTRNSVDFWTDATVIANKKLQEWGLPDEASLSGGSGSSPLASPADSSSDGHTTGLFRMNVPYISPDDSDEYEYSVVAREDSNGIHLVGFYNSAKSSVILEKDFERHVQLQKIYAALAQKIQNTAYPRLPCDLDAS